MDIIVSPFINHYLPDYMCPRYILSDNGTEFKNQLMDQVLQQLGIDHIFYAQYHPQSNGKLEVFYKYLKPKLKKLWKPGYRIVCIEHDGHYLHVKNQATGKTRSCNIKDTVLEPSIEFWNINMQFGRAGKYINHTVNLPTITLNN